MDIIITAAKSTWKETVLGPAWLLSREDTTDFVTWNWVAFLNYTIGCCLIHQKTTNIYLYIGWIVLFWCIIYGYALHEPKSESAREWKGFCFSIGFTFPFFVIKLFAIDIPNAFQSWEELRLCANQHFPHVVVDHIIAYQ